MKLVVADAGPLIIMARSQCLAMLAEVSGRVLVTETVYAECIASAKPGAVALRAAVQGKLIQVVNDHPLPASLTRAPIDAGEKSAIAAAMSLSCPVLVDDRRAREVAKRHGLSVIGSAGVLVKCKELGLVPQVRPILDLWKSCGYFLSEELVSRILELTGES